MNTYTSKFRLHFEWINEWIVTWEQQPQLSSQALWDPIKDEFSGSGGSIHADTSTKLWEMDVPSFLFHLLFHLQGWEWGGEEVGEDLLTHYDTGTLNCGFISHINISVWIDASSTSLCWDYGCIDSDTGIGYWVRLYCAHVPIRMPLTDTTLLH